MRRWNLMVRTFPDSARPNLIRLVRACLALPVFALDAGYVALDAGNRTGGILDWATATGTPASRHLSSRVRRELGRPTRYRPSRPIGAVMADRPHVGGHIAQSGHVAWVRPTRRLRTDRVARDGRDRLPDGMCGGRCQKRQAGAARRSRRMSGLHLGLVVRRHPHRWRGRDGIGGPPLPVDR